MTAEPAVDEGSGGSDASSIEAHAVIPRPVADVWRVLAGPSGPEALLGPGATLGRKGEPWHSDDGTHGVLRSYHPLEQLRVSWHGTPDTPPTILEVDLRSDGDGSTRLDLSQDHLWHGVDVDELNRRWAAGLDRVASLAESTT